VVAHGKAVPIDLESVPKPRLDHTLAVTHFVNQPVNITNLIVINATEMRCNHCTDEQAPKPWSRVDRKHHMAERNATCRNSRPRVPDLEFGKEHGS
jgi:hypothetical protein